MGHYSKERAQTLPSRRFEIGSALNLPIDTLKIVHPNSHTFPSASFVSGADFLDFQAEPGGGNCLLETGRRGFALPAAVIKHMESVQSSGLADGSVLQVEMAGNVV